MTTQVRDDGGSQHAGSCEGGGQCLGLRGTLEVESAGFSDGLHIGVRMIPGSKHEQRWTVGPFPKVGEPGEGVSWVEDGKQGQALLF